LIASRIIVSSCSSAGKFTLASQPLGRGTGQSPGSGWSSCWRCCPAGSFPPARPLGATPDAAAVLLHSAVRRYLQRIAACFPSVTKRAPPAKAGKHDIVERLSRELPGGPIWRAQIRLDRAEFRLFQYIFELFRDIWGVFSSQLGGETAISGWE
jgi:hypothetical protein